MPSLLEYMRMIRRCGKADFCWLSYEPENEVASRLYRSFGFTETGEMEGNEIIAVLKLYMRIPISYTSGKHIAKRIFLFPMRNLSSVFFILLRHLPPPAYAVSKIERREERSSERGTDYGVPARQSCVFDLW